MLNVTHKSWEDRPFLEMACSRRPFCCPALQRHIGIGSAELIRKRKDREGEIQLLEDFLR